MTNEKMLEILNALKTCTNTDEILNNTITELHHDILMREAKKSGNGARQKVVDYIIKSATTSRGKHDKLTRQHKSNTTGKYYITDSYILLEQEKPFDGVDEEKENPMDISRFIPSGVCESVKLPEARALSAWIKSEKARLKAMGKKKEKLIFDFLGENPAFDAELLLKAIEASGRAETMTVYGKLRTAVITGADGNRVAICPMKVQPETPCGTMQDIENLQ